MKSIRNKSFNLNINGEAVPGSYADLLRQCVNAPTRDGFTVDDMTHALAVRKAVDAAGKDKPILLEDAAYVYAQKRVREMRWAIADQEIIHFVAAFDAATNVEVEAKTSTRKRG
ncbi:MAG: hypothetical protein HXY25_06900 [Alphaproteobacteria bacterium]|nr:hypothetical protein [Alphaproteobacteria bacterium]